MGSKRRNNVNEQQGQTTAANGEQLRVTANNKEQPPPRRLPTATITITDETVKHPLLVAAVVVAALSAYLFAILLAVLSWLAVSTNVPKQSF